MLSPLSKAEETAGTMGKLDRRHSLKMNRRKAQAKKKARIKKHRAEKKAGAAVAPVAKKTRSAKAAPAAESAG